MINITKETPYENGSRILRFKINKKEKETPGYFPLLDRVADPRNVMDAFMLMEKESKDKENFEHVPGFVMESDSVLSMLNSDLTLSRQSRLSQRNEGGKFNGFFEFIKEYGMAFLIDPNLDRINNGAYRNGFLKTGDNLLTKEIKDLLNNKEKISVSLLKEPEMMRKSLFFQINFKATDLIAPYTQIELKDVEGTLKNSVEMYNSSNELIRKFWKSYFPAIPVMCIRKNILDARPDKDGKRKAWESIIEEFSKIESPFLILKITDFSTKSKDEKYDNLKGFFQEVKKKIKKPILFLNMNEFSYILFRDGLDFYSSAMGKGSLKSMAGANLAEDQRDSDGLYYVPREMRNVKKRDLKKLPCHCPYCTPFSKIPVDEIETLDWRALRIKHYVWCKNIEIEHLQKELKGNSLRAALLSMFADSKEWKNFTNFI